MEMISLIAQAASHEDAIAIRQGQAEFTYRQLLTRSAVIASAILAEQPDMQESRIAYLVPGGFDYVTVQWGIWRSGGVAVPLSLSATEPELEYAITDSDARTVVTNRALRDKVATLSERLGLTLHVVEDIPENAPATLPSIGPDRRAMILYTSGTTNKPKGVVSTHATLQAQIEALIKAWHWQQDDTIPLFLPLHHIHGVVNVLSCALWSGATVDSFPHFEADVILDRVAENQYSVFMAVPTIYVKLIQMLHSMPAEQRERVVQGFANMRLMVSGSAALPASVHKEWTGLTGQALLERYGMTEIGMALSNPYDGERRPGAVGQPCRMSKYS